MSKIVVTVVLSGSNLEPYGYMYTKTGLFKQDALLLDVIRSSSNYSLKDHFCSSIDDIEPMLQSIYGTVPSNYGDCSA